MYKQVKYITAIFVLLAPSVGLAEPAVTTSTNDPMVIKIYSALLNHTAEIGRTYRF